jgi:hypothetical protein
MDFHFLLPDGTTLMNVRTENTDVREVGFHSPAFIPKYSKIAKDIKVNIAVTYEKGAENSFCQRAISSTVSSTKRCIKKVGRLGSNSGSYFHLFSLTLLLSYSGSPEIDLTCLI